MWMEEYRIKNRGQRTIDSEGGFFSVALRKIFNLYELTLTLATKSPSYEIKYSQ